MSAAKHNHWHCLCRGSQRSRPNLILHLRGLL